MLPKKTKTLFSCNECGYESGKWLGRCPECGQWQTFVEKTQTAISHTGLQKNIIRPVPMNEAVENDEQRLPTDLTELDRVLGGGLVPGAVILVGGEPGIGKSTLMLHILSAIGKKGVDVLYLSGEESIGQIKMRAKRLNSISKHIFLATENRVEAIIQMAQEMNPALLAVDSIQTLISGDISSAPGSVSQVRESAYKLQELAKQKNIPVILVGHVTKDGGLAGPKVLEHTVDTVLYFEGDRGNAFRILRTVKNRFGSTNEIGVFEMKEAGLAEVNNPSEIFLAERPIGEPGSVVVPSIEGTRPILIEVQALVSPTNLGTARRTAIGADQQRLSLLCAVLEKKVGLDMYGHDIFLNIAGGIRIDEPALDLGVISALTSSIMEKTIPSTTVVCGEVGLAGEVRAVSQVDKRLREAERLGFQRFIMSKSNKERLTWKSELKIIGVATVTELLEAVFN